MIDLKKFQNHGKYLMLALDHRGSFKKYINPGNQDSVTDMELIHTKAMIIESVQDQFSGALVDLDWGLPGYKSDRPYLLPLEKSGYTDNAGEKVTELGYSAEELKEKGAGGAKLLLYFNPEAKSASQQIATAKSALADSHANEMPFFLEIVTYGNEELQKSRAEWVLRSLEMLINGGVVPDVWKLEYPASLPTAQPSASPADRSGSVAPEISAGRPGSLEACKKITQLVGPTPWILLTRGETFDVFAKQLQDAVAAGAVGFLAGRALWQEIADYPSEKEKREFLNITVAERFRKISEICLS